MTALSSLATAVTSNRTSGYMPVPLPTVDPPAGTTQLSPPPQDLPTLDDIAEAVKYNKKILVNYDGLARKDDVGEGAVYQVVLTAAQNTAGTAVAPPAWFAPALAASLTAGLAPLERIVSTTYNLLSGDGRSRPFRVIPFTDGTLPTDPPHNLPALVNVAAINALTGPQATAYLNGYNLPALHPVAERKNAICIEIGCTAST